MVQYVSFLFILDCKHTVLSPETNPMAQTSPKVVSVNDFTTWLMVYVYLSSAFLSSRTWGFVYSLISHRDGYEKRAISAVWRASKFLVAQNQERNRKQCYHHRIDLANQLSVLVMVVCFTTNLFITRLIYGFESL